MRQRVPILVTGTHRSGTTWVGRMLSVRPDVVYVHEPFNANYCRTRFHLPLRHWYAHVPDLPDQRAFHAAYRRVLSFENYPDHAEHYSWHFRLRKRARQRTRNLYHKITQPRVLIKDPLALLSAGHLAETFGFQVVCLIRHPLAFCSSLKKWQWSFPFQHLLEQPQLMRDVLGEYRRPIRRLASHEESLVAQAIVLWNVLHHVIRLHQADHPEWIFVRHEDMVRQGAESFRDIYARLGLEFTPACRAAIEASGSAGGGGETHRTSFNARDHHAVLETWKGRLTQEEVDAILEDTSDLRRHFYPDREADFAASAAPAA